MYELSLERNVLDVKMLVDVTVKYDLLFVSCRQVLKLMSEERL